MPCSSKTMHAFAAHDDERAFALELAQLRVRMQVVRDVAEPGSRYGERRRCHWRRGRVDVLRIMARTNPNRTLSKIETWRKAAPQWARDKAGADLHQAFVDDPVVRRGLNAPRPERRSIGGRESRSHSPKLGARQIDTNQHIARDCFSARQLLGLEQSKFPDQMQHAHAGFWGWRVESRGASREDAHRWGYTFATLSHQLALAGFHEHPARARGEGFRAMAFELAGSSDPALSQIIPWPAWLLPRGAFPLPGRSRS